MPYCSLYTSNLVANFGQDSSFAGNETAQGNGGDGEDFYYTPPTGYVALNTDNLPDPSIALPTDHFNTLLFVGDGASSRAVTGVGFAPDWSWLKNRDTASTNHFLMDSVRGDGWNIKSSSSDAQAAHATMLKTLDSDGFTVGSGDINENTKNIVAWNWKAGGTAVSNTDGSTTSSVSANPTAGFSIVKYAGNDTAGNTVGHGLSQAPDLVITKNLGTVFNWVVSTENVTGTTDQYLVLNDTAAASTNSNYWQSVGASLLTFGDSSAVNQSSTDFIAYCFHSVEGYSKVGSYVGNGVADGTFVYTGFRPAFVILKKYNISGKGWYMFDNKRNTYNGMSGSIAANANGDESTTEVRLDFVSNGIKFRIGDSGYNDGSYIYLAFAESPFKTSNAR
jgi:hypothetical protein